MQNKKRIFLKITQPISQHELSYLLEGLKKLDEFDITVSTEIEVRSKYLLSQSIPVRLLRKYIHNG